MIRTNKVKVMTRAAIFEQKEERKALHISHFFKGDYIVYGLLKSIISLTVAFGLGTGIWVVYYAEELMTEKSVTDLLALGKEAVLWYLIALAAFLLISAVVYAVRYDHAQKRLKGYRSSLRRLLKSYQEETAAKE